MTIKKPKFQIFLRRNHSFFWFPRLTRRRLSWKDKWGTPRCEDSPHFYLEWTWLVLSGFWGCDGYWEQKLWITEYSDGDHTKAKATWPWKNSANESTWVDELTNPKFKKK